MNERKGCRLKLPDSHESGGVDPISAVSCTRLVGKSPTREREVLDGERGRRKRARESGRCDLFESSRVSGVWMRCTSVR